MPGVLQHITHTSYGYVDPYVEKARNMVPLLDATVNQMEPYFPPVIQAADMYIDAAQSTAGTQVAILQEKKVALQGTLSGLQIAASAKVQRFFGNVHASALVLIDRSDALVDRFLPLDDVEEKAQKDKANSSALVSRALKLPLKIPLRCTRIAFVKAGGLTEAVMLFSSEQTRSLVETLAHCRHLISDKVISVTAPGLAIVRTGRDTMTSKLVFAYQSLVDGQQVVVAWISGRFYVVVTQLRLPEIKNWAFTKVANVREAAATAATHVSKGVYVASNRVVGDEWADCAFHKVGLQPPK
jgi:hypothetical protein